MTEQYDAEKDFNRLAYDADYFLRGKETGKSLYENYRWMPELTIPMVCSMVSHLRIEPDHTILDFGCARGYSVRAFRELGYDAWGVDASEWAVMNCDPEVKDFVFLPGAEPKFTSMVDWTIAKDVLEHVEIVAEMVSFLMQQSRVGVFAVVPLSLADGHPYVVREYEQDITHLHRLSLASWVRMFLRPGWKVEASYAVPGIKCNYAQHKMGNGFITARRLK